MSIGSGPREGIEGSELAVATVELGTVEAVGRIVECVMIDTICIVATGSALVTGKRSVIVSERNIVIL